MKKILSIETSAKAGDSFSNKLSNAILDKLKATYPGSEVKVHNLAKKPFPHLEETHLAAFFTPPEAHSDVQKTAIKHSDEAIKEIMDADIIVIGVPLYNFGIPSTLKAWIDHIVRAGITFTYASGIPEGLIKNKKVYLAIASGGVYTDGPMKSYDFTEPYLRTVLGFIGLTDITVLRVEGTGIPNLKETAWPKALEATNEFAY
jgi:FMN-dependent NADH-azoreductase